MSTYYTEAEVQAIKEAAFRAGREKGRNEVGLILSLARSTLWAVDKTLDDLEARAAAMEAYEKTAEMAAALEPIYPVQSTE